MTTAEEFREYANEWSFLDMARDWTLAALRLEGVMIPGQSEKPSAATPE